MKAGGPMLCPAIGNQPGVRSGSVCWKQPDVHRDGWSVHYRPRPCRTLRPSPTAHVPAAEHVAGDVHE
eukprot:8806772-Heterocapsa_arctica.AAC.1